MKNRFPNCANIEYSWLYLGTLVSYKLMESPFNRDLVVLLSVIAKTKVTKDYASQSRFFLKIAQALGQAS